MKILLSVLTTIAVGGSTAVLGLQDFNHSDNIDNFNAVKGQQLIQQNVINYFTLSNNKYLMQLDSEGANPYPVIYLDTATSTRINISNTLGLTWAIDSTHFIATDSQDEILYVFDISNPLEITKTRIPAIAKGAYIAFAQKLHDKFFLVNVDGNTAAFDFSNLSDIKVSNLPSYPFVINGQEAIILDNNSFIVPRSYEIGWAYYNISDFNNPTVKYLNDIATPIKTMNLVAKNKLFYTQWNEISQNWESGTWTITGNNPSTWVKTKISDFVIEQYLNLKDNVGILKIQGDVSTYYATLTNGKWNLTKINGADNMSFYYAFPLENRTVTGLYPASYVILNNKLIFTNYSDTQNLPIVEFDFSNAANIKVNHLNINTTQKFLNINIMQKKIIIVFTM